MQSPPNLPTNPDPTLLRAARRARGLTQRAVAEAANVNRGDLSRWERGKGRRPTEAPRHRLAAVLALPAADLLEAPR